MGKESESSQGAIGGVREISLEIIDSTTSG